LETQITSQSFHSCVLCDLGIQTSIIKFTPSSYKTKKIRICSFLTSYQSEKAKVHIIPSRFVKNFPCCRPNALSNNLQQTVIRTLLELNFVWTNF